MDVLLGSNKMVDKDKITTYYSNARELVKQNNPKAARAYVLAILNYALETYKHASKILTKAKTAVFMERWITVSRELYDKGVTDFVLKCFNLPTNHEQQLPKEEKKPIKRSGNSLPKCEAKSEPSVPSGEIDITGLIDEAEKTQGWCAEVFDANRKAVVQISVSTSTHGASGTGFIISSNGYLLTNDHVVFDEQSGVYYSKVNMSFVGDKKKYKLEVLFSDKNADVALCKFNPEEVQGYTTIKRIADYSKLKQGADCLVIGNAFGMGLAPFTGIVRFTKNDSGNLVYTAPSNPGDSGGPVFDRNGDCIGINKSRTTAINNIAAEAYANATPMDTIDELLKKWTSNNGIKL